MAKKPPAKSQLAQGAPLKIAGKFVDNVLQSPSSAISIVTTVGESADAEFLLPFAYLSILEASNAEATEVFAAFVPLESTAYLLADLTAELGMAVSRLEDLATPTLPFEPTRLTAMREYVENARKGLEGIAANLDKLLAVKAAAPN